MVGFVVAYAMFKGSFPDLMILLGLSLFVSAMAVYLGSFMPQSMFLSGTTWTVLVATLFGVICAIASLANIGGVASAPILAAAYSEALVPIGVVMALMGYVMGTGCALIVGKILSIM